MCGKIDVSHYSDDAKEAVKYHKEQLDEGDISYLNSLKLIHSQDEFDLVHATLNKPEQFLHLKDITDCADTFYLMNKNLCFQNLNF